MTVIHKGEESTVFSNDDAKTMRYLYAKRGQDVMVEFLQPSQGHFYEWQAIGQVPVSYQTGGHFSQRTAQNCLANLRALSHEHDMLLG